MQKLPTEIIQIILKIKWWNARKERLEKILALPVLKLLVNKTGDRRWYQAEVEINGCKLVFELYTDGNFISKHLFLYDYRDRDFKKRRQIVYH